MPTRTGLCTLVALLTALAACTGAEPPPRPQIGAPAAVTPGPGVGALPPSAGAGGGQPMNIPLLELATPAQAPGLFLYAKEGNLWTLRVGQQPVQLTRFATGNFPAFPAVSPDGKQVAFTFFEQPKDLKDIGGTDLYLMNVDGSNMRLLLRHDSPGQSIELPFWSPDGSSVWFTSRTQRYDGNRYLGEQVQIERIEIASGTRAVVIREASAGARSADGKRLAFVKTDPMTYAQGLWVADSDGAAAQQVVDPQTFTALFVPAFAPDGKRLVFGAVGEPVGGVASRRSVRPSEVFGAVAGLLGLHAAVAEAHGAPWDLWLVNIDGSGLRRLTSIAEDAPVPVWSPDGKQIAFAGERAIYLVDPEGKQLLRVADEYGSAGLAWIR